MTEETVPPNGTPRRPYIVTITPKDIEPIRMIIRTSSRARAVKCATDGMIECHAASADEVIALMSGGVKVLEDAR